MRLLGPQLGHHGSKTSPGASYVPPGILEGEVCMHVFLSDSKFMGCVRMVSAPSWTLTIDVGSIHVRLYSFPLHLRLQDIDTIIPRSSRRACAVSARHLPSTARLRVFNVRPFLLPPERELSRDGSFWNVSHTRPTISITSSISSQF